MRNAIDLSGDQVTASRKNRIGLYVNAVFAGQSVRLLITNERVEKWSVRSDPWNAYRRLMTFLSDEQKRVHADAVVKSLKEKSMFTNFWEDVDFLSKHEAAHCGEDSVFVPDLGGVESRAAILVETKFAGIRQQVLLSGYKLGQVNNGKLNCWQAFADAMALIANEQAKAHRKTQ